MGSPGKVFWEFPQCFGYVARSSGSKDPIRQHASLGTTTKEEKASSGLWGGQGHNRRTLEQILQIVIAILGEPTNLDMPLFKSDMHVSAQPIDELEGSCSLSSR